MLHSVTTALTVFELVAQHQPIGVSELSRRLGITKSTVQRCLLTLHAAGWLRPEEGLQTRWVITAKCLTLGQHAADAGQLRSAVLPIMEELREETFETIYLVVAEGRQAVLLERLESPNVIRTFLPLGKHGELHETASGKSILASYDREQLAAYIEQERLAPDHADALREELARLRGHGYAIALDEGEMGASAIAAPIVNARGKTVAALCISCPSIRFPAKVRGRFAQLVVSAAGKAGSRLR